MIETVAIIPARGGSQRIPKKNIRDFCGRPIIAWSIETAKNSQLFDRILVSTDDPQIAEVAQRYGAEVPFIRPASLSGNIIGVLPVVQHAVQYLIESGFEISMACMIYATAPFLRVRDLMRGRKVLLENDCDYVLSVTEFPYPIQRALKFTENGRLAMIQPEHILTRSQNLELTFHDAGQFCWGASQAWLAALPILNETTSPVVLPRYLVQDIDTEEDWERATWMFKTLKREKVI